MPLFGFALGSSAEAARRKKDEEAARAAQAAYLADMHRRNMTANSNAGGSSALTPAAFVGTAARLTALAPAPAPAPLLMPTTDAAPYTQAVSLESRVPVTLPPQPVYAPPKLTGPTGLALPPPGQKVVKPLTPAPPKAAPLVAPQPFRTGTTSEIARRAAMAQHTAQVEAQKRAADIQKAERERAAQLAIQAQRTANEREARRRAEEDAARQRKQYEALREANLAPK